MALLQGLSIYADNLPPTVAPFKEASYTWSEQGRYISFDWHTPNKLHWNLILSAVKRLPGKRYDAKTKKWLVPDNPSIRRWMAESGWNGTSEAPSFTLPEPVVAPPLDMARVLKGLYPYQVQFLRFSQGKPRLCLWDGCGVGKTVQALAWIRYHRMQSVLIIANAATKLQWKMNFEKWLGETWPLKVEVLSGKTPRQLDPGKSYIINWDILAYWKSTLANHHFRGVVADEAQAVGDRTSKRTKAFMEVALSAPFLLAMSGTPARTRPVQLWPVLHCINPEVFASFFPFAEYFGAPKETPFGRTYPGATHSEELHLELQKIAIRRLKEDVLKDLPKKTRSIVPMETDATYMAAYTEDEESASDDVSAIEAREKLISLARSAYMAKAASVKIWIKDFLDMGEKLIVYAWHRSVVEDLMECLKDYHPACLYGGMTEKAREEAKSQFITNESCRVLVANIQSGGVGIDGLQTVCSNCCFAECSVIPADHDQAEDRLCRVGQSLPVTCWYLVAEGTIDYDIMGMLDRKANTLSKVIDGHKVDPSMLLHNILHRHNS